MPEIFRKNPHASFPSRKRRHYYGLEPSRFAIRIFYCKLPVNLSVYYFFDSLYPMKSSLLAILFLFFSTVAHTQQPFLPLAESTTMADYFTGFVEHKGNYYFCGARDHADSLEEPITSFVIKTNATGQVVNRLFLSNVLNSYSIRVDAIGFKNNNLYVTAALAYLDSLNNLAFNKIGVIRLDTNLTVIGIDTFKYSGSLTSSVAVLKTVFLKNQLVMGYSSGQANTNHSLNGFLTIYDYNLNRRRHQAIDSVFLARPLMGNRNRFEDITRSSDSSFVVSVRNYASAPTGGSFSSALCIDTSLIIMEWIDSLEWKPHSTSGGFSGKVPVFDYCPAVRHPAGAYFFGPVIHTDSGDRIGLSRMSHLQDTIQTRAVLPGYHVQSPIESLPAFRTPVQLLRNQKEIVVLGSSLYAGLYQQTPSYIRVAKYDTSLNIIWHRSFGKPNTVFAVVGVHELQNNHLMVLASAYDYTSVATQSNKHDFYAFILDSTGAPLSTFTLPDPIQNAVNAYPNPATSEIRFELPDGQAGAEYLLTNLQGKTVLSGTYFSGNSVSVSALPTATYLYKIRTTDGVWHSGLFQKH